MSVVAMSRDLLFATRILNDQEFQRTVSDYLMPKVYEQIRNPEEQAAPEIPEFDFWRSPSISSISSSGRLGLILAPFLKFRKA